MNEISDAGQSLLERAAPIGRSRIDKVSTRKRLETALRLLRLLPSPPHRLPSMAQLLPLSSAAPSFRLAVTPGNGVPRLSVTSARVSRRSVRLRSLSVRCEQGSKSGPGLDVWLSRGAMIGFIGAVGVELTTGKGVLQNVGLMAPLPALALGLTGVVGVVTAFIIFQSGSSD